MELVLVTNTSRNAVVELTEAGKYYSKKEYDIYVNGELFTHTDKQVTSLYGFKPDTDYEITAVYDGKEYGPVELHTDYEFVTLNVRDFGAYGDGVHDDTNAIQCAIMASKKNCRVYVPEGTYRISSIFLSNVAPLSLPRVLHYLHSQTEISSLYYQVLLSHMMRSQNTIWLHGKVIR